MLHLKGYAAPVSITEREMPATNPRISVTVPPAVDAVLTRLAELTNQSKSAIIADLLDTSLPIFERTVLVLQAAHEAQTSLSNKATAQLDAAEGKLFEALGLSMDLFDDTTSSIIKDAERVKRRKGRATVPVPPAQRGALEPATQPPYVTRGSGSSTPVKRTKTTTPKKASKTASKPSKAKGRG